MAMSSFFELNSRHRYYTAFVLIAAIVSVPLRAQSHEEPQSASTANSATAATSDLSLAQLNQKIAHGHADEALVQLDRMAAQSPAVPGVHRLRGVALYTQGKLVPAEQAFAAAVEQDPKDTEAMAMRGITLYRLGRAEQAIPLLEASRAASAQTQSQTASTPSDGAAGPSSGPQANSPVDPLYVLALAYMDTRRYDEARHAFAAQYNFPPDSAAAYLLTARMLLRHEYVPPAQASAHKALEIAPQLPLAHRLLGETELAGNHLDEAIREFQQELQLNPLDPSTYDRLGDAYIRRGDFAKAKQSLQEAVLLDPYSTGPYILLGKALLRLQDPASAVGYLEHAREMDPSNTMTHSLLSQAYRSTGRIEDARKETETMQKLQASSAPTIKDAH